MSQVGPSIRRDKIAQLYRRHHIGWLALLGSAFRPDSGPRRDVDVRVEFEPEPIPGYPRMYGIEQALPELLSGRRADIVTGKSLNRKIRYRVSAAATSFV